MASSTTRMAAALTAIAVLKMAQQTANPIRVAIIGSESYVPLALVTAFIAHLPTGCCIVCSNETSVQRQALTAARQYGYATDEQVSRRSENREDEGGKQVDEWIRSTAILIAFWDGTSTDTANSIASAHAANIPVSIISPLIPPGLPTQNTLF